jgi:diacylglycerol kinase (ATP)
VAIFSAIVFHNRETIAAFQKMVLRQMALGFPLLGCSALLIMKRPRPRWFDGLVFVVACLLVALIAQNTYSSVFTAMMIGLLVVNGAAALERQRLHRQQRR